MSEIFEMFYITCAHKFCSVFLSAFNKLALLLKIVKNANQCNLFCSYKLTQRNRKFNRNSTESFFACNDLSLRAGINLILQLPT